MNDEARKPKKKFPKRSINSILNTGDYCAKIPVLKNGYTSFGIPTITTRNTCAFDCLFQIFAACYVDVPSMKSIIDNSEGKFALLVKNAVNIGNMKATYTDRNLLLLEIYNDKRHLRYVTDKIIEIDCVSSFDEVFRKICATDDIYYSSLEQKYCGSCEAIVSTINREYISIDTQNVNVMSFQTCIEPSTFFSQATCKACTSHLMIHRKPNDVIFFDIEFTGHFDKSPRVRLADISPEINYSEKTFALKAVVEHMAGGTGHYVVHIVRNEVWQTYNDLTPNKVNRPSPTQKVKAVTIVYNIKNIEHNNSETMVEKESTNEIRSATEKDSECKDEMNSDHKNKSKDSNASSLSESEDIGTIIFILHSFGKKLKAFSRINSTNFFHRIEK